MKHFTTVIFISLFIVVYNFKKTDKRINMSCAEGVSYSECYNPNKYEEEMERQELIERYEDYIRDQNMIIEYLLRQQR